MIDFQELLNPSLKYLVISTFHLQSLKGLWMFEKSHRDEIIGIARLMKAKICCADEKLILQGDDADLMYIIMFG